MGQMVLGLTRPRTIPRYYHCQLQKLPPPRKNATLRENINQTPRLFHFLELAIMRKISHMDHSSERFTLYSVIYPTYNGEQVPIPNGSDLKRV